MIVKKHMKKDKSHASRSTAPNDVQFKTICMQHMRNARAFLLHDSSEQSKALLYILGAAFLLLLFVLILGSYFVRPIADDFPRLTIIPDIGPIHYLKFHLETLDGRYSNAIVLALLVSIFRHFSPYTVPLLTCIAIVSSLLALLMQLKLNIRQALLLSIIGATLLILSAPSVFDSLYWMNAATIYTLPIAATFAIIALLYMFFTSTGLSWWGIFFLPLLGLAAGGFNEIQPFVNLTLITVFVFAYRHRLSALGLKTKASLTLFGIGQLVSVVFLKFSPGSLQRQNLVHVSSNTKLTALIHSTLVHFQTFFISMSITQWLLIVCGALAFTYTLQSVLAQGQQADGQKKQRQINFRPGLISLTCIAGMLLPVIATTYANSTETNGLPPHRAQIYITTSLLILISSLSIWLLSRKSSLSLTRIGLMAASFLALTAFIVSSGKTLQVVGSLVVRAFQFDQRSTIANIEESAGITTLSLPSVPIYTTSDAQDLPATNNPNDEYVWIRTYMAQYYHAPHLNVDDQKNLATCPPTHIDWYTNGPFCRETIDHLPR